MGPVVIEKGPARHLGGCRALGREGAGSGRSDQSGPGRAEVRAHHHEW